MDINKIFSIFDSGENLDEIEKPQEGQSEVENALFYIKGFLIIMGNIPKLNEKVKTIFKNSGDLDVEDIEEAGKYIILCKAWSYIQTLDTEYMYHNVALKIQTNEEFYNSLSFLLKYFEQKEMYEKCIKLKKIQDKVKKYLNSENNLNLNLDSIN